MLPQVITHLILFEGPESAEKVNKQVHLGSNVWG